MKILKCLLCVLVAFIGFKLTNEFFQLRDDVSRLKPIHPDDELFQNEVEASYKRYQRGEIIKKVNVPFMAGTLEVLVTDIVRNDLGGFAKLNTNQMRAHSLGIDITRYNDELVFVYINASMWR